MTVKMRMVHRYNNHGNRVKNGGEDSSGSVWPSDISFQAVRFDVGPIRLASSGMARLSASLTDPR